MPHRSHLPAEERRVMSELHRLLQQPGVMRATLVKTRHTCGKPRCRCADGVHLHPALYVSQSRGSRPYMRCVPKAWQERVREWVGRYRKIRELLEKLSEMYWRRLEDREEQPSFDDGLPIVSGSSAWEKRSRR